MVVHLSQEDEFDYHIAAHFGEHDGSEFLQEKPDEPVRLTVHGYRRDQALIRVEEPDSEGGRPGRTRFVYFSMDEALNLASKLIEQVRWHRHLAQG